MIIETDDITLRQLPSGTATDEYGNYTLTDVIDTDLRAQVVINKSRDGSVPDNTETLRVQFKWDATILDVTRYRIVFRSREYRINNLRRSSVLQPNVIKLDCSLVRE